MELDSEILISEAESLLRAADASFAVQSYEEAARHAGGAFCRAYNNSSEKSASEIVQKSLELTNEIFLMIWSLEGCDVSLDSNDRTNVLKYGIDMFNALEMATKEHGEELLDQKEQLRISISNLDPLWLEEMSLKKKLRSECDKDGKEKNMKECAKIFHKMARVRLKRALDKSSFVYCNALLKACLLRGPQNREDVLADLMNFNRALLTSAGAASTEADLVKISGDIYSLSVAKMRKKLEETISGLQKVEPSENEKQLALKKVEYIAQIRDLMIQVVRDFSSILREISDASVKILGPPPCKFAHVAMCGLDGGEMITHSKIETFILLENDAKKRADYEAVLDYFRWYSVLFEVVVINFGETPLHTIGIPSLSDSDCGVARSWFEDIVTPAGIHIHRANSKITSERSEASKWSIKTVKDMAKCVHLKASNPESSLAEKLTKTILIGGSAKIHKKFEKRVHKILLTEKDEPGGMREKIMNRMGENLYDFSYDGVIESNTYKVSVPHAIHTRAAKFVYAIGCLLDLSVHSCFEIVSLLQQKEIINEKMSHSLTFALAIDLEAQVRISMLETSGVDTRTKNDERYGIHDKFSFFNPIGEYGIMTLVLPLFNLQKMVNKIIESGVEWEVLQGHTVQTDDMRTTAGIYLHFGFYKEALSCINGHESGSCSATHNVLVYFMKGLCNMKLGYFDDANENFNLCLAMALTLPEVDQPVTPFCIRYCLGRNMFLAGSFSEARDHLYQAKEVFESQNIRNQSPDAHTEKLHLMVLYFISKLHFICEEYEIAFAQCCEIKQMLKHLDEVNEPAMIYIETLILSGHCLEKMSQYKECITDFERALKMYDDHMRQEDENFYSVSLPVILKLAECHMKLNQCELAEKYCAKATEILRNFSQSERHNLTNIKLILSQCLLKQNKYGQAAVEACETFVLAHGTEINLMDRKTMHEAVKIICKSLPPVHTKNYMSQQNTDDMQLISDCAMRVYMNIQKGGMIDFERDKSMMARIIQKSIFDLGRYETILNYCKSVFSGSDNTGQVSDSFLRFLMSPVLKTPHLLHTAEHNAQKIARIAESCNVRDSISYTGALVVFVGWLISQYKHKKDALSDEVEQPLHQEVEEGRTVLLHCTVKVMNHVLDYYVNSIKDGQILEKVKNMILPLVKYATMIYKLVQSSGSEYGGLMQESSGLISSIATCWMKMQDFETALDMFNEALVLQEHLAKDDYSFKGVTAIVDNIATCLGQLRRLDEAKYYVRRALSMKENRRKSRAFEDHSILQVRVKTSNCSFTVGNYKEAAQTACEAFHEGLDMDAGIKRDEAMIDAAGIIFNSALRVSAHSRMESNKDGVTSDTIQSILGNAIQLQATLKDGGRQLGRKFTDLEEPLLYALGNCYSAVGQYKPALRCFQKALKKLGETVNYGKTGKSLMLNIARCFLSLKKYQKAEKKLLAFLALKNDEKAIHLHHGHAYNLLGICMLKQHRYRMAAYYAYKAVLEVRDTTMSSLFEQVTQSSSDCLQKALLDLDPDKLSLD